MDSIFLITLSDLFVNLSAGWFGAVLIVPLALRKLRAGWWLLITNLTLGTMSLVVAYGLRKLTGI